MHRTLPFLLIALSSAIFSCSKKKNDAKPAPNAYALVNNNLYAFNINSPTTGTTLTIAGLQAGETLVGLDVRPANGELYGVGSTSRLYKINAGTGIAEAVSTAPFATPLNGTAFGVDFNPAVDRLRIVSNTGQNMRINPDNGTMAALDLPITPPTAAVSGAAYSNNTAGTTITTLYDIDPVTDKLYKQDPANNGMLTVIGGGLGVNADAGSDFDISGADKAYALLSVGGVTKLYSIHLGNGTATLVKDFPAAARGLALALNL